MRVRLLLQAADDLEEEKELNHLASRDRVWHTLKLVAEIRADRHSHREHAIQELAAVDPAVCDLFCAATRRY